MNLALLRRHAYVEHEILLPPLMKAGLVMPVLVMKREHAQMWPLIVGSIALPIRAKRATVNRNVRSAPQQLAERLAEVLRQSCRTRGGACR
ncbi:MAG TPA: hypothetical protein VGL52_03315 [Casimicrobiaceae bacterium]